MASRIEKNNVYFFSVRNKYFAYDINTTFCCELDSIALTILPEILTGTNENLENKYSHVYPVAQLRGCIKECIELINSGNFGKRPSSFKKNIQNNIAAVCLHVAHDCNLKCEYCYADTGAFGDKRQLMSHQIMLKSIDFTFAHSGDFKSINIGFFGGEPLLNFKLIRDAVEYAKKKASTLNKNVTFSMTSNAVLLTSNVMDFIKREKFSLIFSLDGPQKIHDQMRKTRGEKNTHATVLSNIKEYMRHYSDDFTVRGTFTRSTPNFSEQVLYLNNQGFKSISIEPAQLAEDNPHSITTPGEVERIKYEYDKLADIYLERFNDGKTLYFFHFDYYLRKLLRPHPVHTECGAGGGYMAIAPDGSIYPCFEMVPEKENSIGHIDYGFNTAKRKKFQSMHVAAKEECRKCWIRYFCGGGCHAFNIRYNKNMKIPYKPQCEFIKHRFVLSAWILSEIKNKGTDAVKRIEKHLQLE